jgi:hypothetical protein
METGDGDFVEKISALQVQPEKGLIACGGGMFVSL